MPNDQQVKVLEEIDVWLGDRELPYSPIQGMALIKAREAVVECQQLLRSKEQDGRTIRELQREFRDYQTRMVSDNDNALATEVYLSNKAKKIEEYVALLCVITADDIPRELAQREAEMEHLRTENSWYI